MRVVFVIPYFYPALGYGGTPRLAYDAARALTQRGHQVTVLTTDAGGEARIPNDVTERIHRNGLDGIQVCFYKNLSNRLAFRHRVFFPPGFFIDIRRRLVESHILHIHDLRSFLSVASHFAARSLGIPYVLSPHGGLQRFGKKSAKLFFDRAWGKAILRDTSALCAISPLEEHEAALLGINRQRVYPFPPAIDRDLYKRLPSRGEFASRWGLQRQRIVLFLGRLHWIKGADLLIEAFSLLKETPDAHLVIAGPDDGAEHQLKTLVKERGLEKQVTFTGFLDDTQKLKALVDSDVVVVPSRHEGFSLTILEAMACETPVILTSACELGTWIQERPSLTSFCSGDTEDLAQKLKTTLTLDWERKMMIESRNFVLKEFSSDALAARAEQLYQSLI